LGFGLLSKWTTSDDAAALAKGEALRRRLVLFQAPLGLVAILLGVLYGLSWLAL
jgi:hypothetical protein